MHGIKYEIAEIVTCMISNVEIRKARKEKCLCTD